MKIDDLLKIISNYDKYGIIGIILIIILLTDIPKSFFSTLIKWLFEKREKDYWTTKPNRSFLILPIVGIISFRKTKLLRQNFFRELIEEKKSKISQLFKEVANVKVGFHQFKSRSDIKFTSKMFNVINGIPGVGKSSFLLNYLEEMHSSNKIDFVFYFNSYSINRSYTGLKTKQENINVEQVWKELGRYNLDYIGITSSLLSYLLNYKYVYFIVDGIDQEEDIENIIGNLNRYINKFHRGNKKLRVLVSSRIRNFQLQQLLISNLDLPPLNTEEVQNFFFSKSEELQLNLSKNPNFGPLVDHPNSLLRFDSKLTKTPLFAEIILIILKEKGLSNIVNEFHQSIASIYKLFIKVLYERGIKGNSEYDSFYVLYRNLAYKTWESGNSIDIEEIVNIFKNSPFDIQFLTESGLLIQNDRMQTDYAFIHQTIPDILAIEALSIKNDFSYFNNKENVREDLQIYLRDEIKNIIQYSSLLKSNPSIAAILLDRAFFNRISKNELSEATRMIIRSSFEYITGCNTLKPSNIESILKIFKNLSEWQGQLYHIILDEVESYPRSKNVLVILLILQINQIDDYIINLILLDESIDILTLLLPDNQYLKELIEPYFVKPVTNERDRKIILFALESDITNKCNFYKKRYTEILSIKSDDEIKFFLSKVHIRIEVFFKEYIHKNMNTTSRLNRLLSLLNFEEIFLPQGKYYVNNKTFSNEKSITFLKQPFKKELKESGLSNAIDKFKNDVGDKLWTFDQFQIAYNCFSENGFMGLQSLVFTSINIRYEAIKKNNTNKVSFAYFESNSSNSNIILSEDTRQIFHQTVLWRSVHEY